MDDQALSEKQAWVNSMRQKFCRRPEFPITTNIIDDDGFLNQDYFRPPKGALLAAPSTNKWTEKERALLIQGIEKYGIGHFREISEELLPNWQPNDLRIKTMRLMGRQNLQLYQGWRGGEPDIKLEHKKNRELGERLNAWKGGTLVYDDEGAVQRALEEMHRSQ
ncbi:uncharacterized protein BJ171DRAFT_594835 [Polychytrium aggregatum]|uniref:uncharacterized protein n=1 Tax=Polychytrium aggregatum TaxID=110093 RepID=UPI0022FE7102|nr:uncharacterized protein BJ171DRAFT_594835 [Polychytrium aggregatum]KAI9209820.1 hypothetical protein BJ171DRAFT_594835 [Polychytrium aggregatum]